MEQQMEQMEKAHGRKASRNSVRETEELMEPA